MHQMQLSQRSLGFRCEPALVVLTPFLREREQACANGRGEILAEFQHLAQKDKSGDHCCRLEIETYHSRRSAKHGRKQVRRDSGHYAVQVGSSRSRMSICPAPSKKPPPALSLIGFDDASQLSMLM